MPDMKNPRIALCLSGGGYRAGLFHLGALRRLNELGILSKLDLISSVSGGSILAAHLATHIRPWPEPGERFKEWDRMEVMFHEFVKRNIRTWPVLRRLLPWNWFRPATQVEALEATYRKHLTPLVLTDLPERPRFVICATDMVNGVLWRFERDRVGSYVTRYVKPPAEWGVAKAVAGSSCFPPVFSPLPIEPLADGRRRIIAMCVSDGGLYDNLGFEPARRFGTVLVSDGGAPFEATIPKGVVGRGKAYLGVLGRQAGAVRKRWLLAELTQKHRYGAYWGIDSAVRRYRRDAEVGYTKQLAVEVISRIRTDLDAFSDAECAVLQNHGYLLVDIAIEVHAPSLISIPTPRKVPYEQWLDEEEVRQALQDSQQRMWLGRW